MHHRERDLCPIPDRWLNCPRKCLAVIADKFLAFKTPLDHKFSNQIKPAQRWNPAMVFDNTKELKVRIGLWIDLTNTTRFYDSQEVKSGYDDGQEVVYLKLQCRGHGETPTKQQTEDFIRFCHSFILKNPLKKIGVHCTHGFNRSGFMIVSYLVEKLDFSVDCALQEFATKRPPGIYKADYIEELYRRYDSSETPPPPPLKPVWCFETVNTHHHQKIEQEEYENNCDEDDVDDDDDGSDNDDSNNTESGAHSKDKLLPSADGKMKRNHKKKYGHRKKRRIVEPKFMEGVVGVAPVYDQSLVRELQYKAREMCGWESDTFPGSQPVSMDLQNIKFLYKKPYRVSWKADGTRYMMLILGENEVYFIDRDNSIFEVSGIRFVNRKNLSSHLTNTLLDGEMVIDKYEGRDIPRYLVYDIVYVNDFNVRKLPFYPQRLDCIEADVIQPRYRAMREGKIDKLAEPFSIRSKPFFPIEKAKSFLSEKFSKQLSHEPDGLIFQPSKEPYIPGSCYDVLKWKPASLNSVDFRLKIVRENRLGMLQTKVAQLYVGGMDAPFAPIKYSKKLNEYNNKIIECKYENDGWVFMRERTDKSFPNVRSTAISVCNSIQNPVTKDYLLHVIDKYRHRDKVELIRDEVELMPPPPARDKKPH